MGNHRAEGVSAASKHMERGSKLGRYTVVGELAVGGMAEILLARLAGPSGFERAVAIKRILPNFVNEQSFVDMFVDEARIAARINHANVVHYEELGQDDGQLYLVMEYLEGESCTGLMRRARSRARPLSLAESLYIVAEAAAGLHAAHEMRDLEGSPLDIVHRDISPQNLFITYAGGVKVMDFGIAKAADRITVTEAGSLKGKFAYMSPEQAEGLHLDRRSDVFSLGIVLYELITGRRLFRRASQTATLRAVREGSIVPPSTYVDDLPPDVEDICMRALATDVDARYPSADAFRRDLMMALRRVCPDELPQDKLRATLNALFADRIEEKRELLRRVSSGHTVSQVPSADVENVELPDVDLELLAPNPTKVVRPVQPAKGKRSRVRLAGLATLALVVLVALVAFTTRARPEDDVQATINTSAIARSSVSMSPIGA